MKCRPKLMRDLEAIRLAKVSGVEGFDYEGRSGDDVLFGLSCDEKDGPVRFHFSSEDGHYKVDLDVLRRTLRDAESRLLRDREEWNASDWRVDDGD